MRFQLKSEERHDFLLDVGFYAVEMNMILYNNSKRGACAKVKCYHCLQLGCVYFGHPFEKFS